MPEPTYPMRQFRNKPVVITAMTFDEMLQYAIENAASMGISSKDNSRLVPWSFYVSGYHVSHENDDCYIVATLEGNMKMTRDDMLIIGVEGEVYPCKLDIFAQTYDAALRGVEDGERIRRAFFAGVEHVLGAEGASVLHDQAAREYAASQESGALSVND